MYRADLATGWGQALVADVLYLFGIKGTVFLEAFEVEFNEGTFYFFFSANVYPRMLKNMTLEG